MPTEHATEMATIRETLAQAIRARRVELDLTQEEAAARCGISTRYWRSLEASLPAMRFEVLAQVVSGLGWTWNDFAQIMMQAFPKTRDAPAYLHEMLDQIWRSGPGPDRDALVAMLRALSHADGTRRRRT